MIESIFETGGDEATDERRADEGSDGIALAYVTYRTLVKIRKTKTVSGEENLE